MQKSRWTDATGDTSGPAYAARFASLAAHGTDVHGEATFCASLLAPGARVLDAGCGTGRVAIRLAELGYDCVGVDNDESMLAQARRSPASVRWLLSGLVEVELPDRYDLVVAAGNVIPLVAAGTEAQVIERLAGLLAPGGLLVAGFGLDPAHLPLVEAPFGLAEYDSWCAAAGLALRDRFATWAGEPYGGGGYAVSVSSAVGPR
jgi:SAM-dependent methyltransferase